MPDDFCQGMDENAHAVAKILHTWQLSSVDEDLFTELGDLQEELRLMRYNRFSTDFAERCITAAKGG